MGSIYPSMHIRMIVVNGIYLIVECVGKYGLAVLSMDIRAGIYWFRYRYGLGMYRHDTVAGNKHGGIQFRVVR